MKCRVVREYPDVKVVDWKLQLWSEYHAEWEEGDQNWWEGDQNWCLCW